MIARVLSRVRALFGRGRGRRDKAPASRWVRWGDSGILVSRLTPEELAEDVRRERIESSRSFLDRGRERKRPRRHWWIAL